MSVAGTIIQLFHRHYGVHIPVKEAIKIPCEYTDVYKGEGNINEQLLIDNIPDDYLLCEVGHILLGADGIGQCGLEKFANWGKHYYSYVLLIDPAESVDE